MEQRKRLNSTLLLLCKVERGDGTFPWELWERAAEAAASDGASPAVGTLIATPGTGVRAGGRSTKGGPTLVWSTALSILPLHTWPRAPHMASVQLIVVERNEKGPLKVTGSLDDSLTALLCYVTIWRLFPTVCLH